jgi:hypothetical protein
MNFRGPWTNGTGYAVNDAVTYSGSTYIAIESNSAAEPDVYTSDWSLLAQAGGTGPAGASGPAGADATISIGTVTTGAAGGSASVTNVGSSSAAILNFTIPQGAAGTNGTGGSTSGISGAAMAHVQPSGTANLTPEYYSVSNTNASATESAALLTWVPAGCTVTALSVYSQLTASTTLTLRAFANPTASATTLLTCTVAVGPASTSCTVPDDTQVTAGYFIDYRATNQNGPTNPGIWTALTCN